MAKFNTYDFSVKNDDGVTICDGTVEALNRKAAWYKAVDMAFEHVEPGTGEYPSEIALWRRPSPSEHHG